MHFITPSIAYILPKGCSVLLFMAGVIKCFCFFCHQMIKNHYGALFELERVIKHKQETGSLLTWAVTFCNDLLYKCGAQLHG